MHSPLAPVAASSAGGGRCPTVLWVVVRLKLCNDLKVAIIRAGKTNAQVARETGLHPQTITDLIKSRKKPVLKTALLISKALGKTVEEIWWLEDDPGE